MGDVQAWGVAGPAGVGGAWVLDQTRAFVAPTDGTYTFRVSGSARTWLWVDNLLVASAVGEQTADVTLQAGTHTLSFRALAASAEDSCGYALRAPGAAVFTAPRDAFSAAAARFGQTFMATIAPAFAAADRGAGIQRVQWSRAGAEWTDGASSAALPGELAPGAYTLQYRVVNAAGVAETPQQVVFRVDPTFEPREVVLPVVQY
jgi:methionine-rich copper-binding protein CopC